MIRKSIISDKHTITIDLPENYIGKQIELLMYAVDEITAQENPGEETDETSFLLSDPINKLMLEKSIAQDKAGESITISIADNA